MAKSHNKKRNVGIVYELLLRHIAHGVATNNIDQIREGSQVIKDHFKQGSELYREFRLFGALVKTTASSERVAQTILAEARSLAKETSDKTLTREKSLLIRSINHRLNDDQFFRRRIPEYRMYATIQTLLNDWRNPGRSELSRMAEYEDNVRTWLLEEKREIDLEELTNTDSDSLVVKIMTEKLNAKFGKSLNTEQKEIVRLYTLSPDGNQEKLLSLLNSIRTKTLAEMSEYLGSIDNQLLNEKASRVHKDISEISLNEITDKTITQFLTISQLKSELLEA
jgi:hypothetical protein